MKRIGLVVVLFAIALATVGAQSAAAHPRLLVADFGTVFAVRPPVVTPSGDGSFQIGAPGASTGSSGPRPKPTVSAPCTLKKASRCHCSPQRLSRQHQRTSRAQGTVHPNDGTLDREGESGTGTQCDSNTRPQVGSGKGRPNHEENLSTCGAPRHRRGGLRCAECGSRRADHDRLCARVGASRLVGHRDRHRVCSSHGGHAHPHGPQLLAEGVDLHGGERHDHRGDGPVLRHRAACAILTVATPDGPATTASDFAVDGQVALSEHKGSSGEPITLAGSASRGLPESSSVRGAGRCRTMSLSRWSGP